MSTYTVPADGTYTSARDGGRYRYFENDVIDLLTAVDLGMPGAVAPEPDGLFSDDQQTAIDEAIADAVADLEASYRTASGYTPVAVTATADGTGTGVVPAESGFAIVTSANADHIVTLPAAHVGQIVRLRNAGTGYELRSSAPETIAINGGAEADAESAIGANTYVECEQTTATAWICRQYTTAGVQSATEVAAAS